MRTPSTLQPEAKEGIKFCHLATFGTNPLYYAGPLIEMALRGGVSTILAYGQTGSGKTHTIAGILDRIGKDMFESSGGKG